MYVSTNYCNAKFNPITILWNMSLQYLNIRYENSIAVHSYNLMNLKTVLYHDIEELKYYRKLLLTAVQL